MGGRILKYQTSTGLWWLEAPEGGGRGATQGVTLLLLLLLLLLVLMVYELLPKPTTSQNLSSNCCARLGLCTKKFIELCAMGFEPLTLRYDCNIRTRLVLAISELPLLAHGKKTRDGKFFQIANCTNKYKPNTGSVGM